MHISSIIELCKSIFKSSVKRSASLYSYIDVTEYSVTNGTLNILSISFVFWTFKTMVFKRFVCHRSTLPIFMVVSFSSSWKHQKLFPVIKCSNKKFICQSSIIYTVYVCFFVENVCIIAIFIRFSNYFSQKLLENGMPICKKKW